MFTLVNSRLLSRLGAAVAPLATARQSIPPTAISRAILASATRRTFSSSTRLSFAVAVKKPVVKAPAVKAKTTAKKPAAAKKAVPKKAAVKAPKKKAAKPKPKPKKRVVVKKKAVPKKPVRITKAMGPPSRGSGPYMVFAKEFAAKFPDLGFTDRARAASAAWKEFSEAEKQPYYAQSAADRIMGNAAYNKWMSEVDPKLLRRINDQRRKKNLPRFKNHTRPKRPMSSFLRFYQEFRKTAAATADTLQGTSKQAGVAWRALPESERKAYINQAADELAAWKAAHPNL